ncbi:hypothetical protein Vadar_002806 [Vaccinium darrowii]|uniref:Uncharacterized protein n=1 Tax=Vaccinium darrowii TaxID=229202 RepID=A0ACB7Z900_9ERIC|nr:hypothetical protein Vadar_002806 [Vaccinium darrowii]
MNQKPKPAASSGREYVDLDPDTQLVEEDDCDTLLVYLPDFKKEEVRLQLNTARTLQITGERPLANNKWLRLEREYPVSTNCDTNNITAKLENGILYIRQPKLVPSPAVKGEKGKPASEPPKPVSEAQKPDQMPKKDQARPQKPTSESQKPDQKPANDQARPQKPTSESQKPDHKPANDQPRPQKPISESQKPDQKPANDQPRPLNTNDQETRSMVDMSKEKEGKKSESVDAARVDKGHSGREKGEAGGKSNGVDEDGKGKVGQTSEGQESCGWTGSGRSPLAMLGKKPMGMVVNLVVGILLVLVIGMYVTNWMKSLSWHKESES